MVNPYLQMPNVNLHINTDSYLFLHFKIRKSKWPYLNVQSRIQRFISPPQPLSWDTYYHTHQNYHINLHPCLSTTSLRPILFFMFQPQGDLGQITCTYCSHLPLFPSPAEQTLKLSQISSRPDSCPIFTSS